MTKQHSKKEQSVACNIPFTLLQIGPRGEIYSCCPAWTTYGSIGTLNDKTGLKEIWNSKKSQYIRKRVLNDELSRVCNMKYCPYAIAGKRVPLDVNDARYGSVNREILHRKTSLVSYPNTLLIAHSGRCNIRCIMCCSNERYVKEDEKLNALIYTRELPKMLPKLKEIMLTGNGDPFMMRDSREFLQKFNPKQYPNVFFSITTNGLLLDARMWQTIQHNRFGWISVSIDGASKETYEYIRRPGRWSVLQENLRMISALRKKKRFTSFTISFVVMKSNYHEMKDFVKMGFALGCDRILFQRIFGAVTPEENINFTRNIQAMKDIGTILRDPIFSDPRVDISTVRDYTAYTDVSVPLLQTTLAQLYARTYSLARSLRYRLQP